MHGSGLNRKVRLMNEKVYQKYAWILLFAIGVIILVTAVPHALGINTDPETVERFEPGVFQLAYFLF